jgi:hypothetical protein
MWEALSPSLSADISPSKPSDPPKKLFNIMIPFQTAFECEAANRMGFRHKKLKRVSLAAPF